MLEVGLGALIRSVGRAAVLDDALEVDLLEDLEAARRRLRAAELVVARRHEGGRSREKGQQCGPHRATHFCYGLLPLSCPTTLEAVAGLPDRD